MLYSTNNNTNHHHNKEGHNNNDSKLVKRKRERGDETINNNVRSPPSVHRTHSPPTTQAMDPENPQANTNPISVHPTVLKAVTISTGKILESMDTLIEFMSSACPALLNCCGLENAYSKIRKLYEITETHSRNLITNPSPPSNHNHNQNNLHPLNNNYNPPNFNHTFASMNYPHTPFNLPFNNAVVSTPYTSLMYAPQSTFNLPSNSTHMITNYNGMPPQPFYPPQITVPRNFIDNPIQVIQNLELKVDIDFEKAQLSDFRVLNLLGSGSFAKVSLCQHTPTGKLFCMKILNQRKLVRLRQAEHVCSEKEVLSSIKHPSIVQLYRTFKDEDNLYILMEFVACGELFDYIRTAGSLNNQVASFIAAEIVLALEYLHSNGIIYRDLKPENLLIDHVGHIKLTDFGFAKRLNDNLTKSMCGTPEYIAPEILEGKGHGAPVDWWSLGVLVFEMLTGLPPFVDSPEKPGDSTIFKKILEGSIVIPETIDPIARDFIQKLVVVDVDERLGTNSPNGFGRGTDKIKAHPFFKDIDWVALSEKRESIVTPLYPRCLKTSAYTNFSSPSSSGSSHSLIDDPSTDDEDDGKPETEGNDIMKKLCTDYFCKF